MKNPQKFNLTKNLLRLKKYHWYRQGAAVKLLYISYPWLACLEFTVFGQKVPFYYHDLLIYLENHYMVPFFRHDVLKKIAGYYWNRQKKDSQFIFRLFNNWLESCIRPYLGYLKRLEKTGFALFNDQELLQEFTYFSQVYMREWRESIFLDAFDLWGDKLLKQEIKRHGLALSQQYFQILTSPDEPSFMQQEQIDLVKIIKEYLKSIPPRQAILRGNNIERITKISLEFNRALEKHSAKYHWLTNDFATVTRLTSGYYLSKIKSLLANNKDLSSLYQIESSLKRINRSKVEVAKALGLDGRIIKVFECFTTLAKWRDHRKSYNQMAGGVLKKFTREFAERTDIPLEIIECMFHWEVKDIFRFKPKDIKTFKERQKPAFYSTYRGPRVEYVIGRPAKKVFNFFNSLILKKQELKGTPAYQGVVRARARLILSQKDFSKMRRGDIIIAHNTRPEFLSVMKIASAFVTEEGGLTCHAAIVARELNKPCIVGVQGVTSVLKDGDRIEVNANKGSVKLIKK